MQGDTTSYNSIHDTINTFFVFCKPDTSQRITKADSLQLQTDSLSFRYFFDYGIQHAISKKTTSSLVCRESMFTSHQLQVKSINPHLRKEYSNDWMVLLLLLCFSLLAWVFMFSRKRVKQIINATYSNRTINQLIRDGDLFKERIAIAFPMIYFVSISLFVFQTSHYYLNLKQYGFYSFFFFLKMMVVIIVLHLLKQRLTKFIGIVFKNNTATNVYLLNGFIFNIFTGIILLPFLLFMLYSKGTIGSITTNLSIVVVVVISILRYLRYIIIGLSFSKFSHFYLFLYLCTLELLPILIIAKLIISLIDSNI